MSGFGRIALLAFAAACGTPEPSAGEASEALPRTRIVFAQHYINGTRLVMENYAGRDLTDLRSRVVKKGEVPVAWVPDDVMRTTLKGLEKRDFADYARPRPGDPKSLGSRAELTVYDDRGRSRAFLRQHGQPVEAAKSFQNCTSYFRGVWTKHRPSFQAATGDGGFGVKRAGYKRSD